MFYYTLKDNKIEQFAEIQGKAPKFMADWHKTNDKIIRLNDGSLAFEKDVDLEAQANEKVEQERIAEINAEITELKAKLDSTDYVVTKIAEGVSTKEDYADVLLQRQEWRKQINELEVSK